MLPSSKSCKFYIYGQLQKILDPFHRSMLGSQKLELWNSIRKIEFRGRQVWHAFESTILVLYRPHLLSNWAHIFFDLFLCASSWKNIYQKYKRKKKVEKKKKNSEWKDKKRGAYKQQPIALFVCGAFCLVLIRCYLSYLFFSLVYHKLVLGTRIGQQLGQVLWTFIQYCYLWLTCVPHTNIFFLFVPFKLHIYTSD